MAKFLPDNALDQRLDYNSANCSAMHLCQGQPTQFSDIAAMTRAVVGMAPGDFTKANGPIDGRQLQSGVKSDIAVTADGTCDHVAWASASLLLEVFTCTSLPVTTADTVNFPVVNTRTRQPT